MWISCKYLGHKFRPYRHTWVEFASVKKDTPYNREGSYILSHVYCVRCGEVREVVNVDGKSVRYSGNKK
jgi:hypothetical protein